MKSAKSGRLGWNRRGRERNAGRFEVEEEKIEGFVEPLAI